VHLIWGGGGGIAGFGMYVSVFQFSIGCEIAWAVYFCS
jgi:hypothetical protein